MTSLRLNPARPLIGAFLLVGAACTASQDQPGVATTSSSQCAVSVGVPGETPRGSPAVLASLPPGALSMDRFYTLTGDCADQARAFEMEHVLFADGRVMAIGSDGSLTRVTQTSVVEPSALSPQEGPRLRGAPLVYAARLGGTNARPPIPSAYVGVWSVRGKSIVAGFRIGADGQSSTPQPLLESDLPIVGVGYFPSPDSPSGQLGVVQQVSANSARLLNYQWYHPGL